ncbi:MAG: DUF3795 domain-containing protein [Sedimentisphaerales bacterium]|nr:DUF3795 domain-containing protein [Sedimentisphaerales bacterium]
MKPGATTSAKSIKAALIAPCGMNCGLCYAYMREEKACPSCFGNDEDKNKSCVQCRIRNCEKRAVGGFKYCFACKDFPCARLKQLDKRYRTKYVMSMLDNLEHIRQFGVREFVRREKTRWACPECGRTLCVHKVECVSCGYEWRSRT